MRKGGDSMRCIHPVIVDGRCLDCGALVMPQKTAQAAPEAPEEGKPTGTGEAPEEARETPKKSTRRRKA